MFLAGGRRKNLDTAGQIYVTKIAVVLPYDL